VRLYDEASPRKSPEGYPIVGRRAQWNGKTLDVMIVTVDVGSAPVPGVTGDSVQVNILTWSLSADGNVLRVDG
jgi:hypothetical protein